MSEFCFRWFVNMPTWPGGCLVKRVGLLPAPSSFFDGLFELKAQGFVRHESFKANRHFLTRRTNTALRARSFRVNAQLVRINLDLSKVRCMEQYTIYGKMRDGPLGMSGRSLRAMRSKFLPAGQ